MFNVNERLAKYREWLKRIGKLGKTGLIVGILGLLSAQAILVVIGIALVIGPRAIEASKRRYGLAQPQFTTKSGSGEEFDLPSEQEIWVRGVIYRQSELKAIGVKKIRAELIPEPDNVFDENAVKVCAYEGRNQIVIGYLPKDFEITPLIGTLHEMLNDGGVTRLMCTCSIQKKPDGSFVATLRLPHDSTVEAMLG